MFLVCCKRQTKDPSYGEIFLRTESAIKYSFIDEEKK